MTIKPISITLAAALVMVTSVGCEKQETASPDDADVEQPDDADADADDAEPADADDEPEVAMLSKASFDDTINEHMQEISDCYVGLLGDNPDLKGHLDAEFTIDAEGTATAVVAVEGSTLTDENLMSCISSAAASWTFDKPSESEMKLRYQFDLAPAE
jgi:hypothetical protein